jgi:hypothetical protein
MRSPTDTMPASQNMLVMASPHIRSKARIIHRERRKSPAIRTRYKRSIIDVPPQFPK